jgi:hypothetical protein
LIDLNTFFELQKLEADSTEWEDDNEWQEIRMWKETVLAWLLTVVVSEERSFLQLWQSVSTVLSVESDSIFLFY